MASPTSLPDSSLFALSQFGPFVENNGQADSPATKCNICQETFTAPKVLPCLHTFCQDCLEKLPDDLGKIQCPVCMQDCILPSDGISGLLSDYAINNFLNAENPKEESLPLTCTGCRTKDTHAVAHCYDCANYLCGNCVTAHQYMHCFEGHHVISLKEEAKNDFKIDKLLHCSRHQNETLLYFCSTCDVPVCKECINDNHPKGLHESDHISKIGPRQVEILSEIYEQSKTKMTDLKTITKSLEDSTSHLHMQLCKSQADVKATFDFYCSVLEERKQELLKELEESFNSKMILLRFTKSKVEDMIEKMLQLSVFVERIMKFSSNAEILMFKHLLDAKLQAAIAYNPEINLPSMDFEFSSNYQAIQVGVKNTFGYIRHEDAPAIKPQPIARPNSNYNSDQTYQNGHTYTSSAISKQFNLSNPLEHFSSNLTDICQYKKWSSGPNDIFQNGTNDIFQNGTNDIFQNGTNDIFQNGTIDIFQNGTIDTFQCMSDPIPNFSSKINIYPLKSDIRRVKMIYHCKFGEFGVMDGQFTEPSGVAVNAQNDIIVADTNSCRIQVFDKEGRFKFHFGESGKNDGNLLYPNRIAVVKTSGDIIVTERSPTHQVQVYNQYGQFVRKFGANVLQHPRGVTVDNKGRIILIECKVMRVIIFDQLGNILQKFGCAKHLEFPNGVVTNDKQEIFISDNRAHCVKVFNYEGAFLRNIGGEGITNYPIGVCINKKGEVLVADNHNNFNITVFTQDGQLVNAMESKVKHDQCFDVALMDDNNIVLASKDYRVYIYSYMPIPGISMKM